MAEDAGAADLIAGGRLQPGISRGSPEQAIDADGVILVTRRPRGQSDADMARGHTEVLPDGARPGLCVQPATAVDVCEPARPHAVEPRPERPARPIWWALAERYRIWAAKLWDEPQSLRRSRMTKPDFPVPRAAG